MTIKTNTALKTRTFQRLFDRVATHLLAQGEKCSIGDKCRYRLKDSPLKCAIGALIGDTHYNPRLECKIAGQPSVVKAVRASQRVAKGVSDRELGDFLAILQRVHDHEEPERWARHLRDKASAFRLDPKVLGKVEE